MADTKGAVLILGASGMLGNALLRFSVATNNYRTWGSVRSATHEASMAPPLQERLICGVDVENVDALARAFATARPDVVVNCVGVVKQLPAAEDPLSVIPINSLLPHRLARLCQLSGARLVHISTDCVFSGTKGMYREEDPADARDLYGLSKYLGEVDYPHAVTLRTSIIGPELGHGHGLLAWFLEQTGRVNGFARAIFSGLPTVELARVIHDHVLPRPQMRGLYHVSAAPISKYDLLCLVAKIYGRQTQISRDDRLAIDRSLDSRRFRELTGYAPPAWPALVQMMHEFG
jgi:dTDP-4-dehydrorhamnose reductase